MGRTCTICTHDESHTINVALVRRGTYRDIAGQYNVSKSALKRHSQDHIPKLLVEASEALAVAEADDLLSRIESLQARTIAILEATEGTHDHRTALAAIREARANLELIGEVTKELDRAPSLNLHLNPEWLQIKAVLITALEPHPAAKADVVRALEAVGSA